MKKIILAISLILLVCTACAKKNEYIKPTKDPAINATQTPDTQENDYEALIDEMSLEGIDNEFLHWLYRTYPDEFVNFYEKSTENYTNALWHECFGQSYLVISDQFNGIYESKVKSVGNSISFVGDIGFADNYHGGKAYDERNQGALGLFSQEILDHFHNSSLVVANAEFAVGKGGSPTPGKAYTFRGDADKAAIFNEMNIDLVTLANNHIFDYGADVFSQTLNIYDDLNIKTIGAGENIEQASEAAYFVINGYKFAFVNANRSEKIILTPGASENSSGVVRCYEPEHFISMIEKANQNADYVIAIVHWGTEYSDVIQDLMLETSRYYIDAGADAIIGHHAHVLQGIEYYDGKPIFYNLGNFLFNDKTLDTAVVTLDVENDGTLNYKFLPALQKNVHTSFTYDQDRLNLIDKMNKWSINAYIDNDGNVLPLEN